jgi:hypothetical protein
MPKPNKKKQITGPWVISDFHTHIVELIESSVKEKRRLKAAKLYRKRKNSRLKYKIVDGKLKKATKAFKGKSVVNVRYH